MIGCIISILYDKLTFFVNSPYFLYRTLNVFCLNGYEIAARVQLNGNIFSVLFRALVVVFRNHILKR